MRCSMTPVARVVALSVLCSLARRRGARSLRCSTGFTHALFFLTLLVSCTPFRSADERRDVGIRIIDASTDTLPPLDAPTSSDGSTGPDAMTPVDATAPVDAGPCREVCDPVRQCGCASPEACRWNAATTDFECGVPDGEALHGESCGSGDGTRCAAGTACLSRFGESPTCLHACDEDLDCERFGAGSLCLRFGGAGGVWGFCSPACDPVSQRGCRDVDACRTFLRASDRRYGTICTVTGLQSEGEECSINEDCVRGLGCVSGRCYRPCVVDEVAEECGLVGNCSPLVPPKLIDGDEYGVCV